MDGRANISLSSKDLNVSGTASIRLERDKKIWFSVKKFGIEAARALITPDSFFVLNRLQNEYTAEPLEYLATKYKIPARFDLLQHAILGNAVFLGPKLELGNSPTELQLQGGDSRWAVQYWLSRDQVLLTKMELKESAQARSLEVSVGDYRPVGLGRDFPFSRSININSTATGTASIDLNFTDATFTGPLDMPYSVPPRFERSK